MTRFSRYRVVLHRLISGQHGCPNFSDSLDLPTTHYIDQQLPLVKLLPKTKKAKATPTIAFHALCNHEASVHHWTL